MITCPSPVRAHPKNHAPLIIIQITTGVHPKIYTNHSDNVDTSSIYPESDAERRVIMKSSAIDADSASTGKVGY